MDDVDDEDDDVEDDEDDDEPLGCDVVTVVVCKGKGCGGGRRAVD